MSRSKERVTFDFSVDALDRLDACKENPEQTRAEVIRLALRAYEWLRQAPPESIIDIRDKNGNLFTWIKRSKLVDEKEQL